LGITSGYVDLGGDIRAVGPKPDGSPWQVGIRHPRKPGEIIASIPLVLGSVATSGDYERYFEKNGQRYCHILSPKTGLSVRYWQSVSVLAPRATPAGATCTIAMLKQEEGLEFLQQSGFSFLAIDADGQAHTHQSTAGTHAAS
jgi:thiamine biosynthesis lipoprotein